MGRWYIKDKLIVQLIGILKNIRPLKVLIQGVLLLNEQVYLQPHTAQQTNRLTQKPLFLS